MKRIILIIFLFSFSKIYSQKIEKQIGSYKITKVGFFYGDKKKKRKISKSEYYFDDSGKIIEKIKYGRHHYNKLNIIGEIEQFFYTNDKLELSKSYSSSCKSCDFFSLYSKYNYDNGNNLISENTYYQKNDSLFMPITYIYKSNIKETHFGKSTYYEKVSDSTNRIVELNQRYENTKIIRWQHQYKYIDNFTIGIFQTFYNDKTDRTEVEIKAYDDYEKRLISIEKIGILKIKTDYIYSKDGFISKIKEYKLNMNGKYELEYLIKFKIEKKQKFLNQVYLRKINSDLIDEE